MIFPDFEKGYLGIGQWMSAKENPSHSDQFKGSRATARIRKQRQNGAYV